MKTSTFIIIKRLFKIKFKKNKKGYFVKKQFNFDSYFLGRKQFNLNFEYSNFYVKIFKENKLLKSIKSFFATSKKSNSVNNYQRNMIYEEQEEFYGSEDEWSDFFK